LKTVEKIGNLFDSISLNAKGLNYNDIIKNLESKITSVKQILPAKCISHILINQADLLKTYMGAYDKGLNGNPQDKLRAAIIIGEIGKKKDLSSLKDIVKRLDLMF